MKKFGFWIFVLFVLTGLLASEGIAKTKKPKGGLQLKDIETLYFISQDLDENTAIVVKPDKGCYCACRDGTWSCTDLLCGDNMKHCENPPAEAGKNARSEE